MARARILHPQQCLDEDVARMSLHARYVWAFLPCHADRAGRMEDRPFSLKLAIVPTDAVEMGAVLDEIAATGLIERYEVAGRRYIQIRTFAKYQNPHKKEAPSRLPPPPGFVDEVTNPTWPAVGECATKPSNFSASPDLGPVEPRNLPASRAVSDLDPDPVSDPDPARDPDPERARTPPPWLSGEAWWRAFGLKWRDKYGRHYGNGSDAKAKRDLDDLLRAMPEDEAKALWGMRDRMFAAFFGRSDAKLVDSKHPLALFVSRFTDFRPDLNGAKGEPTEAMRAMAAKTLAHLQRPPPRGPAGLGASQRTTRRE